MLSLAFLRLCLAFFLARCVLISHPKFLESSNFVRTALVVSFGWMLVIKWTQHMAFETHSHDLGLFHSSIWNAARGHGLLDAARGEFYLADHLIFFLYLLAPFFWIYPGPEMLFVLSAAAFSAAAFLFYQLAEERLKNQFWAVLLAAAFITNRYLWGAFLHEFHPDFFVPVFFFLLFLSFFRNYKLTFLISLAAILSLKEDNALYLIPIGFYFLLQPGGKKRGILTISAGALYFFAAFRWGLPYFMQAAGKEKVYGYLGLWAGLGGSFGDIARNVLTNPSLLFSAVSARSLSSFFVKFIGLPVFSPLALIYLLPPLFLFSSSAFPLMRGFSIHYGLLPATLGFLASLEGLKNVKQIAGVRAPSVIGILISILILVGLPRFTFYIPMKEAGILRANQANLTGYRPLCVQSSVFPHLIPEGKFSIFPECAPDARFLLLQPGADPYPLSPLEFERETARIFRSAGWKKINQWGRAVLLERV